MEVIFQKILKKIILIEARPIFILNNVNSSDAMKIPRTNKAENKSVFIVHGHDNELKQTVARFIEQLGLNAVVLHEMTDGGKTIIEKIEHYTEQVNFAIILYTPCDKGRGATETTIPAKNRARQNVVFEHGYLMAKIGRKNVFALQKGEIETPGDISGIIYTPFDDGGWKEKLKQELKNCDYKITLNEQSN